MKNLPHQTRDNFDPEEVLNALRMPTQYSKSQSKEALLEEACQALIRERHAAKLTREQIRDLYETNRA